MNHCKYDKEAQKKIIAEKGVSPMYISISEFLGAAAIIITSLSWWGW